MAKLLKSLFGSNEEHINLGQVNKFISFDNDKLILINQLNELTKPIKIISFLGNARIGKSTLMNCYLSHKLNQNIKLFNTSNKMDKHCTSGIDMLIVETKEYNLLLLDVQGLDLNNSKDDCKLMLFIYLISNLIIFNPKTILDNTVLSSLSSLTSIMTYIQNKSNKPVLLFRPRDINQESEYNSEENLKEMLSETEDQYSNVRCSINKLFTDIQCHPTYYLDKKDLKLLSNDKFIEFMDDSSNCFKDFCLELDKVITDLDSSSTDNFNTNIQTIIEDINLNKKIDYKIFDITMREASGDIKEWIFENIDKTQYDVEMESNGTQLNYDTIIKPRIDYCELILSLFDKRFEKTTPKIRIAFRDEIYNTFYKHINAAIKNSELIAENNLDNIYKNDVLKTSTWLDLSSDCHLGMDIVFRAFIDNIIDKIKNTIWLNNIKNNFLIKLDNEIINTGIMISNYKLEESIRYKEFIDSHIRSIKSYVDICKIILSDEYIYAITNSFSDIIKQIITKINDYIINLKYIYYDYQIYLQKIVKLDCGSMDNNIIDSDIYAILSKDLYIDYVQINDKDDGDNYDNNTLEYIRHYLHIKYESDFKKMRQDKISDILLNKQEKREIFPTNILLSKKIYLDNNELFELIQEKNNKIKFNKLNIFNYTNDKEEYASKYAYIVNNLHIHDIYSEDDFNIKYKDILHFLNKRTGDKWLDDNINLMIIDILFKKALELI